LGVQFLKHLSRNRLLLHLLDISPVDGSDPVNNYRVIEQEVRNYSEGIADKDRWLVFTKLDLLSADDAKARQQEILDAIDYTGPVFQISAVSGLGTLELSRAVSEYLENLRASAEQEAESEARIRTETHEFSLRQREQRRAKRQAKHEAEDDDDDYDVEVHYEP
jgi:GTP-binding protein